MQRLEERLKEFLARCCAAHPHDVNEQGVVGTVHFGIVFSSQTSHTKTKL